MKNFSTWILVMFMAMFWVFRLVVAFTTELDIDFAGIKALNMNMEIILLFVALACFVLIIKRNIVGALVYLLAYGMYFGVDLYNNAMLMLNPTETFPISAAMNAFISLIGMIIPVAILFDLLVDKNRKAHPVDKKTDWFYTNEQYDRKYDERADKNNYRTL